MFPLEQFEFRFEVFLVSRRLDGEERPLRRLHQPSFPTFLHTFQDIERIRWKGRKSGPEI